MSSNHNHINNTIITRDNYEEYFLLYIDDELTAAQKAAVEAFAAAHPDLKAELDILADTKLDAEEITFGNKEALLAANMQESGMDEMLLLYVDEELAEKEKKEVEEKIAANASLQLQHQLLLKTKLDKTEIVAYPNKEELYRKEERKITYFWLRIAAAVIVIAGAGAIAWFGGINNTDAITTTVALQTQPPVQQQQQTTTTAPTENVVALNNSNIAAEEKSTEEAATTEQKQDFKKPFVAGKENTTAAINHKVKEVTIPQNVTAKNTVNAVDVAVHEISKTPQQIINTTPVTNAVTPTYNNIEASNENQVPVYAAATPTNEKSGSVKGFLRKATRFIERRANIKTVNSDDELLIGAVAFNLK